VAVDSVVVVGDVITDIIVNPKGPIAWGSDTQSDIRPVPGGSGPSQAAWIATSGIPTYFVGRVGLDDIGRSEGELRDFGVEPILAVDHELATGVLVTIITEGGERSFLVDRGANRHLTRTDMPDHLLNRAGILHLSGYSLFEPIPRTAALDYAKKARSLGVQISVDPSSAGYLRQVGPQNFLEWTRGMHICFPNTDEAEVLTGCHDPESQIAALTRYYDLVVLKRGRDGAMAGNAAGERWQAAAKPVNVVDTIGAGDAFFGRFISAYFRGLPMTVCLQEAVAAGTLSTTLIGGRPPRPERVEP
jgi:sugar/nucleoside kinase (ribokinase family)